VEDLSVKLAIDASHGSIIDGRVDPGVCVGAFREVDWSLLVSQMAASRLGWTSWPVELRLLRPDAYHHPSLGDRGLLADGFDLVLSIHANSGARGEHGPLCFHRQGDRFAAGVSDAIIRDIGRHGEYVDGLFVKPMRSQIFALDPQPPKWQLRASHVVGAYRCPCVLLEAEYTSHDLSLCWLMSEHGLGAVAKALLAGVQRALVLRGEI